MYQLSKNLVYTYLTPNNLQQSLKDIFAIYYHNLRNV